MSDPKTELMPPRSGPGARPGTLVLPPDSPPPRIRLMEYDAERLEEREIDDVEELVPYASTAATTWIDVQGFGNEATLRRIGEIFGLHRLALADAVNVPQRPKADLYEEHMLVIARAPHPDFELGRTPQVCLIVGAGYLISFEERYFGFFDAVRGRLRAGNRPIRSGGPGYLAYALIDSLVDHFFPALDALVEEIDDLEEGMIASPSPQGIEQVYRLRRRITVLRRVARPQRDALQRLVHEPTPFIEAQVRLYLRDTHDHAQQVMEVIESSREMAIDLMDTSLAVMGHRSNEVMKVLTVMGSIFIPLTFVAGIYGMNFEYMPELKWRWGYPLALGAMATLGLGMLAYFHRRGWVGGSDS